MKKALLIVFGLFLTLSALNAQSNWEAGVRFGNDFSIEATIPFASPRLHPAVYFDRNVAVGLYFDWLFDLEGEEPTGFRLYPGVGPELYFYDGFDMAAAGDFGVEYSFNFPLTIGIDWRPNIMLTEKMRFSGSNWGIFARFRISKGVKLVKSN
jgi:hypothetical protein